MPLDLICTACRRAWPFLAAIWRCDCGGRLAIAGEPSFDPAAIDRGEPSLWRCRHALPDLPPVSLGEGFTPLQRASLGGRECWLKLDYLQPTGSFKDRGATLLVSRLRAAGVTAVVEDSSGNAGSALAVYAARAGIRCTIYCPATTAEAKTAMMAAVGADVVRVPGPRENAAAAVREAAGHYASHVHDPTYRLGTQTIAFEIVEQLGWRAPARVVLPVGNGSLLLGVAHGFKRLLAAGVIDHLPRLIGVQAAACAPLASAWAAGAAEPVAVRPGATVAAGVAIAAPALGGEILAAVRESEGAVVSVGDESVTRSVVAMHQTGYYLEPTAALGAAWFAGRTDDDETVIVLTGAGWKSGVTTPG